MLYGKQVGWSTLAIFLTVIFGACGGGGNNQAQFKATVKDRMSRNPMANVTVTAVSNTTGDPISGQEKVSAADGTVLFEGLPGDKVGFLCHGIVGQHVDTYQFNISTTAQDEELWLVDLGTYQMAPALAGVKLDTTKGLVAGSIYWVNASDEEEPIGCAKVTSTVGGIVRYFGANELPVKPASGDAGCSDPNCTEDCTDPANCDAVNCTKNCIDAGAGRDGTHPNNGLFLIANMTPGPTTMKIMVDGVEKGSVNVVTFGAENTVLISNIYADSALDANPTPAGCQ